MASTPTTGAIASELPKRSPADADETKSPSLATRFPFSCAYTNTAPAAFSPLTTVSAAPTTSSSLPTPSRLAAATADANTCPLQPFKSVSVEQLTLAIAVDLSNVVTGGAILSGNATKLEPAMI